MENIKNTNTALENKEQNAPQSLSDESRVKVMSPSMLVFKRFIRNRLAVIGFVILAVMFLFSFVGPIFTPYKQEQQFSYDQKQFMVFAEFKLADQFEFYNEENAQIPKVTQRLSMSKLLGMTTPFAKLDVNSTDGKTYYANKLGDGAFEIFSTTDVATYTRSATDDTFSRTSENPVDDGLYEQMMTQVRLSGTSMFTYTRLAEDGYTQVTQNYIVVETPADGTNPLVKSTVNLYLPVSECVASTLVFHDAAQGNSKNFTEAEKAAIIKNYYAPTAMQPVGTYTCDPINANGEMMIKQNGQDFAMLSKYVINSKNAGEHIDTAIKSAIASEGTKLANSKEDSGIVEYTTADGKTLKYQLTRVTDNYSSTTAAYKVSKEGYQRKIAISEAPSKAHVMGTDVNGMDVMTRLMYGGRVSLMVGFVVVAIELVIGVILGGIAGYFSGWVDVIIMRFIELFNCIPFYPMMMIIGAILDARNVGAQARIYLLMVLLGVLNWPGIARIVRGQILSLREQDFIVATEASGIPVSRRIFRHLIPNVIPLLIVNATMSLGGIIITEATLSFLGLGVKYPAASWGSIINQAQDSFVLQSYPWIWIPAGILILLTVLGFNFVGDGLRDAFDPKMKR